MIDRQTVGDAGGERPVVFKIGGSLHEHPQLRAWLQAIATQGAGRAVIVPGGGPHARLVRRAQQRWGFDDGAAHRMALLAMDQYARLLLALEPRLSRASIAPQMHGLLRRGDVVVLAPSSMLDDEPSIAQSWEVTADTLALWLAQRLGAMSLVLVKSVAPAPGRHPAATLAARGIIDRAFHGQLVTAPIPVWWVGPEDPQVVRHLLDGGRGAGEVVSGQ